MKILFDTGICRPWTACWMKPVPVRFYLRQSAIADMVVEAIQYNAAKLEH